MAHSRDNQGQTPPGPAVRPRSVPVLTSDLLWPTAVLAGLFFFVSTHPIRPHDFWWHLKVGQEIAQTHQIPQVDVFSYTVPGSPYASYNIYWLADLVLYWVYALGGPALNIFVHAALITGVYLLLFLLCQRLAGDARMAAGAVFAAGMLGFENWNLRPQAITFLLFTVYLWLVYSFRTQVKTPRWLVLAFPALMVIWVNCHGSFPLGIVLLGIWLVETVWERARVGARSGREIWVPVAALVLTAAATLLNPQGVGIFGYLRQMSAHPVVRSLPEWAPASLSTRDGIAFLVLAPLGLILLLWAGRARSGLFHWLMLLTFALLACRTGRAIVWFGLVLAPIVAEVLPRVLPRQKPGIGSETPPPRGEQIILALLMLFFAGMIVISLPWLKHRLPLPERKAGLISAETPVAATEVLLQRHLPGNVFHDMAYGSYLIWRAQPQYRVFVDPRIELYPAWLWDIYHSVSRGDPGWQHYLSWYGVRTVMLSRIEQAGLVRAMRTQPQWRLEYEDRHTVVFVYRG